MAKSQVENILNAAGAVAFKRGIANLTIEAVAEKAGLSKGGVLYHFGTKEQLIEAMVQRIADKWRDSCNQGYENAAEGPGRMARGLLAEVLSDSKAWTKEIRDTSSALFAALAYDPKLLAPMQKVYREMHQRLADDGLPPGVAVTVLAAIDGMWLWWVLGFKKLDDSLIDQVRTALDTLLDRSNS